MKKRIVFKNEDGSCGIIVPSPKWAGTIEELAQKDVPDGLEYTIIDASDLPQSRNYRDAWKHDLSIDLEKAKKAQKNLIIQKAHERVTRNEFGEKDFSTVKTELEAIDFDTIDNLDDLYNAWPKSIENRAEKRAYKIKET